MFDFGTIASKLKLSRVIPEYKKKGSRMDVKSYRITAISSVILRVYEIAMQEKYMAIINSQLSNPQHGFRPKRSVTTNLLNLSIASHETFSKGQQLDVFLGDFANAFDKLDHGIFIWKMWKFGIGRKSAKWFYEFVCGRRFYVQIGKVKSRVYVSTSGVPAGSILGPLLFLTFIDDISDCVLYAMVLLFADDIKMSIVVGSQAETRLLQMDINNILEWSVKNKLPFNPGKCNVITFRRKNEYYHANYVMGDHVIERVDEVRDLGLLTDFRRTFASHIEQMTMRARQSMGYIKWISKGQFGTRALKVLYTSYVRSKLEFASVIWDPSTEIYRSDIESIQKQFVMYAFGDTNRIPPFILPPYEERCKQIGLDKLSTRRSRATAMIGYELYNGYIDDTDLGKRLIRVNPKYSLRESRLLFESSYRNDYSYNQPMARIIRSINEHGQHMTLSRTRFKEELKKKLENEASDIGD